jgi:hypothetical protein
MNAALRVNQAGPSLHACLPQQLIVSLSTGFRLSKPDFLHIQLKFEALGSRERQ